MIRWLSWLRHGHRDRDVIAEVSDASRATAEVVRALEKRVADIEAWLKGQSA